MNVSLSPWNPTACGILRFSKIYFLPKYICIKLWIVECEDIDGIHCSHREETTISELGIPLEVESKEGMYLSDTSDWEVELWYDIMGQFDSQDWEEAFLYAMNEEFSAHGCKQDDALVRLGNCEYLQICDSLDAKIFDDFDQFYLKIVDLEPQILESDDQIVRTVSESCNSFCF